MESGATELGPGIGGRKGWVKQRLTLGKRDVLETNYESLRLLNVERNGNIVYTYKDGKGNVVFGLYDCQTRQNEHLYTFEKDLHVISCSVNSERTLLAASLVQSTKERRRNELQPGSKCLTLLVEISPINGVKVLKAVDSCVWVQFLYPHDASHRLPQSHLLLVSEEKYIEQFHIQVIQEDGNRVVIKNSGHLPRDRIAEDFVWAQWDMREQRLYYIDMKKSRTILKCIQFNADESFTLMFETALDIPLSSSEFKLVNFGCGYQEEEEKLSKHLTLYVFTSHTGSLCVCYSQKFDSWEQMTYSVFYFHAGYRKTFTVAPGSGGSQVTKDITFLNLDFYVAVYLPGHFFHLLNIQHPDLICHSLFLTAPGGLPAGLREDGCAALSAGLWPGAAGPGGPGEDTRSQTSCIIQWISENFSTCHSFDLIQEFIIASSYWSVCPETRNMDVLLQYSSVLTWNKEIPGITLVTEEIPLPLMKVRSLQGYWEKLNSNLEHVKYAMPPSRYTNGVVWREWHNLVSEEEAGKRRSTAYMRNILHNAVKVISDVEARHLEPRLTPVLQEEDPHQRLLMGLMVSELKDHLLRHLQGVKKKIIEQMAVDYTSKLLHLICCILETSWRKHNLDSWALRLDGRGSAAEFAVFHLMTRILEATSSLFLPLPPGFHTLHTILGVHCLPLHSLLHYIDNGVLFLTETAVTRLLKDLDNTEKNEKLKFSIIVRLPPLIGRKIYRLWDHPVSSIIISRNHVTRMLKNYKKQPWTSVINKSSLSIDFLPLNYLIEILTRLESSTQALNDLEGHDNVDAEFVEEAALKHTTVLLGL
ncbi:gamma-secretase-activating protein isoform X3 [Fukomys damarensis]|uniref:gamma-secretase-activating protein isoform X3 n=1 Tax=Fukomys damarensis TaxID=885580 RepID=UPI00145580F3|nr:gamma-secretase-activating protein isoform X3 [Fukomys damarensis]